MDGGAPPPPPPDAGNGGSNGHVGSPKRDPEQARDDVDAERDRRDRRDDDRYRRDDRDRGDRYDRRDRSDRDDRYDRDRGDRYDRDRGDRYDRDRGDRYDRDRRGSRGGGHDRSDRDRRDDRDRGRDRHDDRDRGRDRRDDRDRGRRDRDEPEEEDEADPSTRKPRKEPSASWDVPPPSDYGEMTPLDFKEMIKRGQVPGMTQPLNFGTNEDAGMGKRNMPGPPGGMGGPMGLPPVPGLPPMPGMPMPPMMGAMGGEGNRNVSRRLYVGGIPPSFGDTELISFINEQVLKFGLNTQPGAPLMTSGINRERNFSFIEFRSAEEATKAISLDGITAEGVQLRIKRPKDYMPTPGAPPDPPPVHIPGMVSNLVADTPNKLFVGNLPIEMTAQQVQEILSSFGPLRSFHLPMAGPGANKGFAFCEFLDVSLTDMVCEGLNNMEMVDKRLVVQRAAVGKSGQLLNPQSKMPNKGGMMGMPGLPGMPGMMPLPGMPMGVPIPLGAGSSVPHEIVQATTILVLMNMVTREELVDDEEYEDIIDDIRSECQKSGTVVSLEIPRPVAGEPDGPGVGKIFVEFSAVEEAQKSQMSLSGRKFGGNVVMTSFWTADKYAAKEWN